MGHTDLLNPPTEPVNDWAVCQVVGAEMLSILEFEELLLINLYTYLYNSIYIYI